MPASVLCANLSLAARTEDELVVLNANNQAVDMSGWTLSGGIAGVLPAGTVVDAGDTITLVRDRKAWIAANITDLGDRVVVGNFDFVDGGAVCLVPAEAGWHGAVPLVATRKLKGNWFDASAANQERGADVTSIMDGAQRGKWSASGDAKGTVESRLGVRYIEVRGDGAGGDRLRFTPDVRQKERRISVVEMSACFDDVIDDVESAAQGAVGAFTLARNDKGEPAFFLHDGGRWHEVSSESVMPAAGAVYRLRVTLDARGGTPTVSWSVKIGDRCAALSDAEGATRFAVSGRASSFAFAGCGEVGDFCGDIVHLPGFSVRIQ